jgi:hypothetical protein
MPARSAVVLDAYLPGLLPGLSPAGCPVGLDGCGDTATPLWRAWIPAASHKQHKQQHIRGSRKVDRQPRLSFEMGREAGGGSDLLLQPRLQLPPAQARRRHLQQLYFGPRVLGINSISWCVSRKLPSR